MPRIANTSDAAKELGFTRNGIPCTRIFLAWAKENDIQPVHGKKHHLWWDINKLNERIDNQAGIQSESKVDYDSIVARRLKNRNIQSEIPAH